MMIMMMMMDHMRMMGVRREYNKHARTRKQPHKYFVFLFGFGLADLNP